MLQDPPITSTIATEKVFHTVALSTDIKEGVLACVSVLGKKLVVTRLKGVCHALDNRCTHAGGPLCRGRIVAGSVECPWHGALYDITTGKPAKLPARLGVASYTVRERDGNVEIAL